MSFKIASGHLERDVKIFSQDRSYVFCKLINCRKIILGPKCFKNVFFSL